MSSKTKNLNVYQKSIYLNEIYVVYLVHNYMSESIRMSKNFILNLIDYTKVRM